MQSLLRLPFLHVCLHEGLKPVLELQWLQYATSAELQTALLQALHLSQEHQVKGWVADDRLQGAIRPRDLAWAELVILFPLEEMGLERFAQLESENPLNRHTVDNVYSRTMPLLRFEVRRFDDIAQARSWASGK